MVEHFENDVKCNITVITWIGKHPDLSVREFRVDNAIFDTDNIHEIDAKINELDNDIYVVKSSIHLTFKTLYFTIEGKVNLDIDIDINKSKLHNVK